MYTCMCIYVCTRVYVCMCACALWKRPGGVVVLGDQEKGVIPVAFLWCHRDPGRASSFKLLGLGTPSSGDFLPFS